MPEHAQTASEEPLKPIPPQVKLGPSLFDNLDICAACVHYIKLDVFRIEDVWFIGQGCKCGVESRLSRFYVDPNEARMDLVSGAWRHG
jgi:hypothetical protein